MKTVYFNKCWSLATYIAGILMSIIKYVTKFFVKKKQKSGDSEVHGITKDPTPVTIFVDENIESSQGQLYTRTSKTKEQNQFVDWNNWGNEDDKAHVSSPMEPAKDENVSDLFQDMEPKFVKPKLVRLKSKPTKEEERLTQNKFEMEASTLHIESELGTWVDEQPVGWDEEMDDAEISHETAKIIKQKKKAERERRANEQQRKKEEREVTRANKKPNIQIGVKLS